MAVIGAPLLPNGHDQETRPSPRKVRQPRAFSFPFPSIAQPHLPHLETFPHTSTQVTMKKDPHDHFFRLRVQEREEEDVIQEQKQKLAQSSLWSTGNFAFASGLAAFCWGPFALLTLVERPTWRRKIRIGCLALLAAQGAGTY